MVDPQSTIQLVEIAPAIKPTLQNKGQNVDTKSRLDDRDLWYMYV